MILKPFRRILTVDQFRFSFQFILIETDTTFLKMQ